jgi:hypothetical protein
MVGMEIQMQAVLLKYQQENTKLTERALIAEAGADALQARVLELEQQVELQRQMLEGEQNAPDRKDPGVDA